MNAQFLPSVTDLESLLRYVLSDPYLFISSSTVMTTGLIAFVASLGLVVSTPRFVPWAAPVTIAPRRVLRWLAPKLALTLVYFGVGSMVLATEILLRFHADIPLETETQFRSGVGHLVVAAIGIAVLLPLLRAIPGREWVSANFWALGYWAAQIAILTPPWFAFQGQSDLVLGSAKVLLGVGFAVTLYLHRQGRSL